MKSANRINRRQAWFLVSGTMYGVTVLVLPFWSSEVARETAWLPVLLIGGLSVILAGLVGRLGERFPGRAVTEMVAELWGKPLGVAVGLAVSVILFLNAVLQIRFNSELIKAVMLPKSPPTYLVILLALACLWTIEGGLSAIARLAEILIPMVIGTTIIVFALAIRHGEWSHLLPVGNFPVQNLLSMRMLEMVNCFSGFVIVLYLVPFLDSVQGLGKTNANAVLVGTVMYAFIVAVTVSVLGAYHTIDTFWSGIALAKSVHIRGIFIERLDYLFLIVWIGPIFLTCVNLLFFSAYGLIKILNLKRPRLIIWTQGLVAVVLALLPKGLVQLQKLSAYAGVVGLGVAYVLPILLYFTARLRRKGEESHEANA